MHSSPSKVPGGNDIVSEGAVKITLLLDDWHQLFHSCLTIMTSFIGDGAVHGLLSAGTFTLTQATVRVHFTLPASFLVAILSGVFVKWEPTVLVLDSDSSFKTELFDRYGVLWFSY